MTEDQVRVNERRVIGALLLNRITPRDLLAEVGEIERIGDPLLRSIALGACCLSLLRLPADVGRVAKCVRGLGHEGPIEREIEQLMQEGSLHVS